MYHFKSIIFAFAFIVCLGPFNMWAQPQYMSPNGTSNNIFPFLSTTNNMVQCIYHQSDFTPTIPSGMITTIYYMVHPTLGTSGLRTFTNLQIRIGTTALNNTVNGPWNGGLTTVYFAASVTVNAIQGQWLEYILTTPFLYDGTSNLI